MFDGVHLGHRHLLAHLRHEAGRRGLLTAAVTFSRHPLATLAPDRAPMAIDTPDERCRNLRRAGADRVIMLDFDRHMAAMSARDFMAMLHRDYGVDLLTVGFNHRFGAGRSESVADYCRYAGELGMEIVVADECRAGDGISSSAIRSALERGDVAAAGSMLGRDYEFTGTVSPGRQLGRTIGFPTANLNPDCSDKIMPARGVYACRTVMPDGSIRPAMVNIGRRPTVSTAGDTTVEAHIIDYSGDLYGAQLTLQFVQRLRDEQRFDSAETLRRQLERDRRATIGAIGATGGA